MSEVIRVRQEVYDRLKQYAVAWKCSMREVVEIILKEYPG